MANNDNTVKNKVSNHIQHQLPEFIQADHPVFSQFVKLYYQFLESAEVTFSEINNYVREEKPFTILEFGVGYSTIVMAQALYENYLLFDNIYSPSVVFPSYFISLNTNFFVSLILAGSIIVFLFFELRYLID